MRLLLTALLTGLVFCFDGEELLLEKINEDPLNAFSVETFPRPRLGLNLHTGDRLPREVTVHSYDILLELFFNFKGFDYNKALRNTFNGQVSIVFSVLNNTNQVELASAVKLQTSKLSEGRRAIKIEKLEPTSAQHLIVHSAEKLVPGKNYTLAFKYDSKMSGAYRGGVYYYEYADTSLVASIFETTYAREAFPCFDDPWFKSSFTLSLIHPKGAKAYGNEEIAEQRYFDEQRVLTRFKPTVQVSSYLIAFAVGDFVESNFTSKSGVLNRAIAVRAFDGFTQDSALVGAQCVDAMESLVKFNYPLKKLDHLDTVVFAAGGMENFGLIIYGGYVPNRIGQTAAEEVGRKRVICHETAHQWFGDVVTADRWGWEFLHESFATYFEIHALGQVEKFSYLSESALAQTVQSAISYYSYASHPIVDNVSHFDGITYNVGGGLLNSIRHVLTDEVFYEGLKIYQHENAFKNAGLDTLLQSFVKARKSDILCGDLTFTEHAKDYFLRTGVPTVDVLKKDGRFQITQTSSKPYKWNVPVFVLDLDTDKEHVIWLLKDGKTCSPDNFELKDDGNYVFNNDAKAFATFRIHNDIHFNAVAHDKFPHLSLHNHYYIMQSVSRVKQGEQLAEIVYNAAKKTKGNVHYSLLRYLPYNSKYYKDILTIISDNFDYEPTGKNRVIGGYFLDNAVRAGIPSAVKKTTELFEQFKEDCAPERELVDCPQLVPEFRQAVYRQGVTTAEGRAFIDKYRQRLTSHKWHARMRSEIDRANF
ncbi:unnamed protein product [Bursaphelenchus xylophilus]|uniref:Aminopeptidase n=1 Tax=Bursaphelenchus xylophilus TaxID=6326 RepID=A0A1I7S890_BURXY|nr:unnamed protein product [Bursaphelenchus xylophilus]CAG9080417.1 unnamed protein product [Bursaphelenchus xylophilus]